MVHKTGLEDYYVVRNQKKLRFGYTTGSCAAGAARGAAELLLGEDEIEEAELMTGYIKWYNPHTAESLQSFMYRCMILV